MSGRGDLLNVAGSLGLDGTRRFSLWGGVSWGNVGFGGAPGYAICSLKPKSHWPEVGKTFARFLSLEMKKAKGRISPDQLKWKEVVEKDGGLAGIIRCDKDIDELLK